MNIEVFEEYLRNLLTMDHVEEWHPYGMTVAEYAYLFSVVIKRRPCNMLVFGVGLDSPLWNRANEGGCTLFLENNPTWTQRLISICPELRIFSVEYNTKRKQHEGLLKKFRKGDKQALKMKLPSPVKDVSWDLIFVDAPKNKEGRMKSIYMASHLGKNADILVHDCDRKIERIYIKHFLRKRIHQVQMLGHYKVK